MIGYVTSIDCEAICDDELIVGDEQCFGDIEGCDPLTCKFLLETVRLHNDKSQFIQAFSLLLFETLALL